MHRRKRGHVHPVHTYIMVMPFPSKAKAHLKVDKKFFGERGEKIREGGKWEFF